MIDQNINELINRLITKTDFEQAIWRKTSRDTEFMLTLESGSVITIDKWFNNNEDYIDFAILSEIGEDIYRSNSYSNSSDEFKKLNNLYEVIQAKYHNKINRTLNSILFEINSNKVIGQNTNNITKNKL
ncbi:hypothetical protein [Myroides marinus]|uniref:hypothetical protein n=1 Tax=Myroides marinus TaxID=703342 RepID=UPI002577F1D6|nr:hypothetical protein [Myroides marinus]MDM1378448.1 hypothetical protein [Myroides marinus]MDM1385719.1 hypothetical protein [Myroides marinus]MDM1392932.1 hypothetical protein [Myroides marinus]